MHKEFCNVSSFNVYFQKENEAPGDIIMEISLFIADYGIRDIHCGAITNVNLFSVLFCAF